MEQIRISELARRYGVSSDYAIYALKAIGIGGRYFPAAIVGDETVRKFEAQWGERLRAMTASERLALRPPPPAVARSQPPRPSENVSLSALMRDLKIDWAAARSALEDMGMRYAAAAQPRTIYLSPTRAQAFRKRVADIRDSRPLAAGNHTAQSKPPTALDPLFSARPEPRMSITRTPRRDQTGRRRPRTAVEDLDHLPIDQAASQLAHEAGRGKRHRGPIDAATQQWLEHVGVEDWPPFEDQFQGALAETRVWNAVGFLSPERIVMWRDRCPGISPATAWTFEMANVSPRLACTRWNGRTLDPSGHLELWRSVQPPGYGVVPFSVDDAIWLLRRSKLIA